MTPPPATIPEGLAWHRVLCRGAAGAVAAAAWIETRCPGVKTTVQPAGDDLWAVEFLAIAELDLDFLRPVILPPA